MRVEAIALPPTLSFPSTARSTPMVPQDDSFTSAHSVADDPIFRRQMRRLHELTVCGRWLTVSLLWLGVAPLSLWGLRSDIALLHDYFTWTAVRYGLAYNPLSAFGLALCIGMTVAVLIWQSRNILMGLSDQQKRQLEQQLLHIRERGPRHPLWKWVCRTE